MTQKRCEYAGDRDGALVAYLYDEIDPALRATLDAHLTGCAVCRDELAELGSVRARLGRWEIPGQGAPLVSRLAVEPGHSPGSRRSWWHDIPAWAQVAAALLFLGVAAGLANLDARFERGGLSVSTGWMPRSQPAAEAAAPAVEAARWRAELAALESRLRSELGPAAQQAAAPDRPAPSLDAQSLARVRALIGESERRQQRELALRVAEVVRDVNAQRQADLVRIDRSLGQLQTNTGMEVMRQRELLNYVWRTSQQQR
jgi:hypothetical protein